MADEPARKLPDARIVVTLDTKDVRAIPKLKTLNPILQEILEGVRKGAELTRPSTPAKFGRLSFSEF